MSIPRISGYTGPPPGRSLIDEWQRPDGDFPDELWPDNVLRHITPDPVEWITVAEHYFTNEQHGGRGSVLVEPSDVTRALIHDSWIGHSLGQVGVWDDGRFDDGLSLVEGGIAVEFFCHARSHHGLRPPSIEVSLQFLWYWNAIRDRDGWFYLDRAGRDRPLVRESINQDQYCVEVRALEVRQFLAARGRVLIAQVDHVPTAQVGGFDRVDAAHRTDWCNFSWVCVADAHLTDRPGFSRLLGQYAIQALAGVRVPRWEERREDRDYPEFLHGINPATGAELRHSCNPDELGTYFDTDDSRLHYLTPVCFSPEVLARYVGEPSRYRVTSTRLECLDLWGVSISTNTAGLVEVYLGDLGRDVPSAEWNHWMAHNVPPEGTMSEDRFRRDFLNEFASSTDLPATLRSVRAAVAERSKLVMESPIWRELQDPERTEFERLHAPTTTEPRSLASPVLTLTKAFIDAIDSRPLRSYLGEDAADLYPLQMFEAVVKRLGGDPDSVAVLRSLQQFRSKGGIAHLSGSDREMSADRLGITGMTPRQAFDRICLQLIAALDSLTELFDRSSASGT
jgi:hypothetical protein